jgi:hypothetical protein
MTVHDHSTASSAPSALPAPEPVTQWTPPALSAPPGGSSSGTAGPPARKKNPKVALVGALVAVAVASGGVTAGIMAATGSGRGNGSAVGGPGGNGGFGGRGFGGAGGGAMAALHGTYVVSDGNGNYTTELAQTGTVSAVSAGSITVKSEDGYSKTYAITSSTSVDSGSDQISSVATGHTVRVVADSKASATAITDTNLSGGQNLGGQNGQNQDGPGGGGTGQGNGQAPGQ